MARQSDHEIDTLSGCWQETIEAYEALYFNVRDRLEHRDVILCSVLGEAHCEGLENCGYEMLWKVFAYHDGPHVLDALLRQVPAETWAMRPECAATVFQDIAVGAMKQNAAVAALKAPVEAESCLELLDVFSKIVELERTTDGAAEGADAIQDNLRSMLGELEHLRQVQGRGFSSEESL